MKTRDIKDFYKMHGEGGLIKILEGQNEQLKSLEKSITELALMQDKIIDTMTGVMTVAGNMKETIDRINNPKEEELGISTQSIDRGEMN